MSKGRGERATRSVPVVSFLLELVVYAVFVTGYFLLVLNFLGASLCYLYQTNRTTYAVVALVLIIAQGVLLEMLTSALLRFLERWSNRG
jgi:hypothetical protein